MWMLSLGGAVLALVMLCLCKDRRSKDAMSLSWLMCKQLRIKLNRAQSSRITDSNTSTVGWSCSNSRWWTVHSISTPSFSINKAILQWYWLVEILEKYRSPSWFNVIIFIGRELTRVKLNLTMSEVRSTSLSMCKSSLKTPSALKTSWTSALASYLTCITSLSLNLYAARRSLSLSWSDSK